MARLLNHAPSSHNALFIVCSTAHICGDKSHEIPFCMAVTQQTDKVKDSLPDILIVHLFILIKSETGEKSEKRTRKSWNQVYRVNDLT